MSSKPIEKPWNPFAIEQWIAWLSATFVAGITMVIFLYSHFETKEHFEESQNLDKDFKQEINARMIRIEDKLDTLLLKGK